MTFDDNECYCLLLAADLFCDEYAPATAGESAVLDKATRVRDRLRGWHNDLRKQSGVPLCCPGNSSSGKEP